MNKLMLMLIVFSSFFANAQTPKDTFWHLNSYNKRSYAGIDLEKGLALVKDKTPDTLIVAVIDAGVDVNHPDFEGRLWTNAKEIAGNGIDDDDNGYIDDIYGWNFCGDVTFDNMEVTREYLRLHNKYAKKTLNDIQDKGDYNRYQVLKEKYLSENMDAKLNFQFFQDLNSGFEFLEDDYGKNITKAQLEAHKSKNKYEERARLVLLNVAKKDKNFNYSEVKKELDGAYEQYDYMYHYGYNVKFDPREEKVGDNYGDVSEKVYGNNKVYYGEKFSNHGTHVAGIIAANSENNFGAKGICQSCKIMSIRAVPEGDERDKDVANSIRYAVDNGAKVINMSFGKGFSSNPAVVKEAIAYAQSKGVLLVHAAGNDAENNDIDENFPNDNKGEYGDVWLEIGASSWMRKPKMLADFSNYGKEEVDVFAPGVAIYSTTPENQYEAFDGTSMASPVAAGVAALVWSYYPNLTAQQVKEIITKSALPIKGRQRKPGSRKKTKVEKLSQTGSVINVAEALKMAELITNPPVEK
jgi:cell wall-associated protease